MIRHDVTVNGIEVRAEYTDDNVREIFIPLLRKLTELHRIRNRRVLAMLAAPPGAGKSTLLSFLERLSKEEPDIDCIQTIGMDGFHRRQEYLLSHTTVRDGKDIPMVEVKGSPETFDLEGLADMVNRVSSGEKCGWPVYDRHLHNPVEDAIQVTGDIVLLEGNYLLLDADGWRELSEMADYTILIRADEDMLKERLVARRIASGHPAEEAEDFVYFSDMYNARLCLEHSKSADLILSLNRNGSYTQIEK